MSGVGWVYEHCTRGTGYAEKLWNVQNKYDVQPERMRNLKIERWLSKWLNVCKNVNIFQWVFCWIFFYFIFRENKC